MSITIHESPVWRAKANFIIMADVSGRGLSGAYEQLWSRQMEHNQHEVCCIPFFTYGISLGDIVWVDKRPADGVYLLRSVVRRSGRCLLRIWSHSSVRSSLEEQVVKAVNKGTDMFFI